MDINAAVGVGVFVANNHRCRPQVSIEFSQGLVLMSSPIYVLQCTARAVHYCAGHGRPGGIEKRRSCYGHSIALREVRRVWASVLSDPLGRQYLW